MYSEILTNLDLSKNEAVLYETLLRIGEASAGTLSTKSHVNRRNVYDSIDRLVEKGLIFEIRTGREVLYRAVDPQKLLEKIEEKRTSIEKVLPELQKLYRNETHDEDVFVYRGLEGWKNYVRDIMRIGTDIYTIGGKGAWSDPRVRPMLSAFNEEAKRKSFKFHVLFDHEVKDQASPITKLVNCEYRFLARSYSSPASIDIFGDRIVISTVQKLNTIDEYASFTVVVNQQIADAHRIWFKALWETSEKPSSNSR